MLRTVRGPLVVGGRVRKLGTGPVTSSCCARAWPPRVVTASRGTITSSCCARLSPLVRAVRPHSRHRLPSRMPPALAAPRFGSRTKIRTRIAIAGRRHAGSTPQGGRHGKRPNQVAIHEDVRDQLRGGVWRNRHGCNGVPEWTEYDVRWMSRRQQRWHSNPAGRPCDPLHGQCQLLLRTSHLLRRSRADVIRSSVRRLHRLTCRWAHWR